MSEQVIRVIKNRSRMKEKGKRLFDDTAHAVIMGVLNPMKTKHFMASHIDTLDDLKDNNELIAHMNKMFNEHRYFQLVVFKLVNLPKINEAHGREVGNVFMAEYVKKLKSTFITDYGDLFRITGIEFAMTITDPRKMEILAQGVKGNPSFLNLSMQYGSITAELEVVQVLAQQHKMRLMQINFIKQQTKHYSLRKTHSFLRVCVIIRILNRDQI